MQRRVSPRVLLMPLIARHHKGNLDHTPARLALAEAAVQPRHGCGRMLPKRIWRAHNISTTGCAAMPANALNALLPAALSGKCAGLRSR